MTNTMHRRYTRVLSNSDADRDAGRDMVEWVGVSDATEDEFNSGVVHGRRVDVDEYCTRDCPGCP